MNRFSIKFQIKLFAKTWFASKFMKNLTPNDFNHFEIASTLLIFIKKKILRPLLQFFIQIHNFFRFSTLNFDVVRNDDLFG